MKSGGNFDRRGYSTVNKLSCCWIFLKGSYFKKGEYFRWLVLNAYLWLMENLSIL